ncbi:transposase [Rickettsiella grylli]|uniref:transposase n=1 Tax=Rickettsiella grylli TaxID=59196 RepID=UPI0002D6BE2F|nr:transposase [Rickettsiella grylli]
MKKKKFSESQIITVLKEYGTGVPAVELARKYGIGESTIYTWQTKYGIWSYRN